MQRSFDKLGENFVLEIRKSSAQKQKLSSEVFFSIRSMHFLKHLANRSLKVRKKIFKEQNIFQNMNRSSYSNVLAEWNFGILLKNLSSLPEGYAGTFRVLHHQFFFFGRLQLRFHNLPETLHFKHRFSYKKVTQECGIEHVFYSFDGSAEKLLADSKYFRSTSESLFGKSSPFYVERRFTKNCRTLPLFFWHKFEKVFKKLFLNNLLSDKWKLVFTNLLKFSCSKSGSLLRKIKNFFRKGSSRYVHCSS